MYYNGSIIIIIISFFVSFYNVLMYYNGSILENDLRIIWNYNRIIPHEDGILL